MLYFYVNFLTPAGPGAAFYRGDKHILHPEAMRPFCEKVARQASMATKQIMAWELVVLTYIYELPQDVAKAMYPGDFAEPQKIIVNQD